METTIIATCKYHGRTEYVQEKTQKRCKKCRVASVAKRRRNVKEILVREAGGKCQICGYDKCIWALEFHHIDPNDKVFTMGMKGVTRSIDKARLEAKKCVLLCSNCHREVEHGVTKFIPTGLA